MISKVYLGKDPIELYVVGEIQRLLQENTILRQQIKEGAEGFKCAVCGREIPQLSIQRMTRPILWHDRNCFRWKPRKIMRLQQEFGCDIVGVLKETAKKCGSIKAQCEVLGISIPYLYSIVAKYCKEDFITFMAKNSSGKRKELYDKKVRKRNL